MATAYKYLIIGEELLHDDDTGRGEEVVVSPCRQSFES
jgi:hypothetical protein